MKSKRRLSKQVYVIGAMFVLAALLPLATAEDGQEIDVLPPFASLSLPAAQQIETGDVMPEILELDEMGYPS